MESRKKHCTAVVIAAGSGKRMGGQIPKQFMLLGEMPVLWYSLHIMEQSAIIDDVILVTGPDAIDYARTDCGALSFSEGEGSGFRRSRAL